MTALTAPAPQAAHRRPVPWTKLAWVTWRQHRATLAGVLVLLGGLSVLLVLTGLRIRGAYSSLGLGSCAGGSARCQSLRGIFAKEYFFTANSMPRYLQFAPALIGAFAGGPLLAREFETGTFRFAWTQGAGRTRWIVTKLILLAAVTTAAALAFSLLFSWWYRPFEPVISRMLAGQAYEVEGIVFAARTLFGVMLGALAGAVIRRVVPAIAAALAGWLAVCLASVLLLRPHFQPPVVVPATPASHIENYGSAWTLSQWWTSPAGRPVSQPAMNAIFHKLASRGMSTPAASEWLAQHHHTLWVSYQPASRFWSFQLVEGGGLLVLALLLGAAALWTVRRRA